MNTSIVCLQNAPAEREKCEKIYLQMIGRNVGMNIQFYVQYARRNITLKVFLAIIKQNV